MPKEITLSRGLVTIVDDWNYDWLNSFRWCCDNYGYASRNHWAAGGERTTIHMHRLILKLEKGDGEQGDHINHDRLDNREVNLRVCSHAENTRNQKAQTRTTSSRFKGVCWSKEKNRWIAQIYYERKPVYLGRFKVETAAAQAYDNAALQYFGDFACTNKALGLL